MTSKIQSVLTCEQLVKEYQVGPEPLRVLDNLDFHLEQGEWVSIVGASGSGKTTFLNMVGGLDDPSSGRVTWLGEDIRGHADEKLGQLRNNHLGFVYQFHHLLPEFSALENVAMPLWIKGIHKKEARATALHMLEQVGLASRCEHKPAELSGGERQRVAIARALVTEPAIVLMDEPTGNLDRHTAESIQALLRALNERVKTAFIIVTHDLDFAGQAEKIYHLNDGRLTLDA